MERSSAPSWARPRLAGFPAGNPRPRRRLSSLSSAHSVCKLVMRLPRTPPILPDGDSRNRVDVEVRRKLLVADDREGGAELVFQEFADISADIGSGQDERALRRGREVRALGLHGLDDLVRDVGLQGEMTPGRRPL